MALRHAVLGLVIERPGYGYQLTQRLHERCPAWGWEGSGVYGAIDSLVRDGHLRNVNGKRARDSGRAAPRTVYKATPGGLDYFRGWMLEPSPASPVRQELDLKMQFATPEFLPHLIEQTLGQEHQCMAELQSFTAEPVSKHRAPPQTLAEAFALLQRDGEIKLLRLRVEWLQQVRRTITEMQQPRRRLH